MIRPSRIFGANSTTTPNWVVDSQRDQSSTAARQISAGSGVPTVVADSGSDNVNRKVDELLERADWRRVLAQVEVAFSNSMIEGFGRSLKHSWIYLHSPDTAEALRRLVEFYVTAHNEVMPHSAFEGQIPDENYFGTGSAVTINLAIARKAAREERMKLNRAAWCGVCVREDDPRALNVQRSRSRMS